MFSIRIQLQFKVLGIYHELDIAILSVYICIMEPSECCDPNIYHHGFGLTLIGPNSNLQLDEKQLQISPDSTEFGDVL